MHPVISVADLQVLLLSGKATVILIDARNTANPLADYENGHLPGARFIDVNRQLADIKSSAAEGGRHPLPSAEAFAATLGSLGVMPTTHVVVYDDKSGANAAARLWWMMRSIGHEKVQVLDGGMPAAVAAGVELKTGKPVENEATRYPVADFQWPLATMNEVEAAALSENDTVIDVRDAARYRGEVEPLDIIAGHIPGAINIPYSLNLEEDGTMKSPTVLRELYSRYAMQPAGKTIVHCGSGITACHTLLAMAHAGLRLPALYTGSWSEWCNNNKPVATGA